MPHDIVNGHIGHNHAADHLHSHMDAGDTAADLQVLAAQFIDGFRSAADKAAYLRLAGVPMKLSCDDGPALNLVDVRLTTDWQVATAAPAFGSRELNHMPYPGEMIRERTNLHFVYVSLMARREVDLRAFLADRLSNS